MAELVDIEQCPNVIRALSAFRQRPAANCWPTSANVRKTLLNLVGSAGGRHLRNSKAFVITLTLDKAICRTGNHRIQVTNSGQWKSNWVIDEGPCQVLTNLAITGFEISMAAATNTGSPPH